MVRRMHIGQGALHQQLMALQQQVAHVTAMQQQLLLRPPVSVEQSPKTVSTEQPELLSRLQSLEAQQATLVNAAHAIEAWKKVLQAQQATLAKLLHAAEGRKKDENRQQEDPKEIKKMGPTPPVYTPPLPMPR